MFIPLPFYSPMDAVPGLEINTLLDYLFKFFLYSLLFFYRTNKERKPFGEFVGGKPSFGAEWRPLGVCVAPRFFLLP